VAVTRREDGAVVAEERCRQAVQLHRPVEALNDVGRFHALLGIRAQEQARVVVDQVEDLHHLARGQAPGGDVRLPQLVGQLGAEADQRRARALVRLWDYQPLTPENAPDARERWDVLPIDGEVLGDRRRPGIVAESLQLAAQLDDRSHGLRRGFVWAAARAPRARLKRLQATLPVAGQQLVDPAAMNPMSGRQLGNRTSLSNTCASTRYRALSTRRLPRVGVSYVLTHVSPIC
jgi:hypothetical protein